MRVIRLAESLPHTRTGNLIAGQLIRCGTSVGANYRAACRGKSAPDVLAKLAIVEEEGDESAYWMELVVEAGLQPASQVAALLKEADEIVAMTVSSIKTLRARTRTA